jgi:hypothetical protein
LNNKETKGLFFAFGFFLADEDLCPKLVFPLEKQKINNFQDTQKIDDKQSAKPNLLVVFGSPPQSPAFPKKGPDDKQNIF